MPEKKRRNPFEDHINSEAFDVSHLKGSSQHAQLGDDLNAFFDDLGQSLETLEWEHILDERQKLICTQLCEEIIVRNLRPRYGEALDDFTDEQLVNMLIVPVAISMLAERRLNQDQQTSPPEPEPVPDDPLVYPEEPPVIGEAVNEMFLRAVDFVVRLFKRR